MKTSDLASFYAGRHMVLWVEDPLTRTYLRALWSDREVRFLVAGGNDAVVGAVADARRAGHANVFGLRDRDFLTSNQADWADATKQPQVFRPSRHEIENYLIRPDILAALGADLNPQHRTEADIGQRAQDLAMESAGWMAVRAVVHDVRDVVAEEFPKHPDWGQRAEMAARSDALSHLSGAVLGSSWAGRIAASLPISPAWIEQRLDARRAEYAAALASGKWPEVWSGKDIFKELAGHVNLGKRKAVIADELAKAVGEWQNVNERHGELWDLHAALRQRAGLPPA